MIGLVLNVIFAACFLLGVAVGLGSTSRRPTKVLFLVLCGCLAAWALAVQWFLATNDFTQQVVAAKLFYFVAALFSPTLFLLAIYFPHEDERVLRRYIPIALITTSMMLAWIILSSRFIVESIQHTGNDQVVIVDQFQYITFTVFFVSFFLTALGINMRKYVAYVGVERSQAIWYTVGIGLTSIPGFYGNLILPYRGDYSLIWIGPVGVSIFLIMTFYSIVRHSLFDIRLAVVRTLAYTLSLMTMGGLYFALAYLTALTFFKESVTTGISMSPINIVLALILAFVFQPIKQFFDHVTNQIFYRDRYDTNEFITRLGRELTSTTHLHDVLEKAGKEIETTLKARGSMFLIFRDSHPDTVVSSRLKNHFNDNEYSMLRGLATVYGGSILEVESLGHLRTHAAQQLHAVFAKRNIALVLPLIGGDETIGYLLLGEQMGGGYAKRDIQALETIADELVIAIQNARSVHEVRELNAHLEQRIKTATEDLQASNTRLVKLDATKDEFVSMASHQLRTPLTSVKGYISMVIEGDAGKITRAQRQLLEEAFTSSERMVHLIGDFLNVSRLQTGKFMIDFSAVDLAQVVAQEVEGIRQIAQTHGMTIIYTQPARFPLLYVDENKLRQVIMNFIDNAIYYSPDSREPITVKLAIEEGDAVLRIIDKGMGVPKDAQKQLFGKFFRAENARKQRPDGTGIGLFLAKKIIDGHGGKLVFESIEGEGSTFGFRLPIKKLSTQPSEIADDHTPPKTTQL